MQEAYIVAGYRTAVGKAKKGVFRFYRPDDLAIEVIKGLMAAVPQLDVKQVDDVIVGNAVPEAEQPGRPRAFPDQRVERAEQGAGPHRTGQPRVAVQARRLPPALHRHGRQDALLHECRDRGAGGRRRLAEVVAQLRRGRRIVLMASDSAQGVSQGKVPSCVAPRIDSRRGSCIW